MNMRGKVEDGRWVGCGHKVRAVILDNNILSIATYMEFDNDNPDSLCLDCWDKKYLRGIPNSFGEDDIDDPTGEARKTRMAKAEKWKKAKKGGPISA